MLAGFGTLVVFGSTNIPNSSEHTVSFNNVVGLQMVNLYKVNENIQALHRCILFGSYLSSCEAVLFP